MINRMKFHKIEKTNFILWAKAQEASGNTDDWVFETKEDGDWTLMEIKDKRIQLFNPRGANVTEKYPEFNGEYDFPDMTIIGEMCVFIDGVSNFNDGITHRTHLKDSWKIQNAVVEYPVTFVGFDLLKLDDIDYRNKAYKERKGLLDTIDLPSGINNLEVVKSTPLSTLIKLVDEHKEDGKILWKMIMNGGEGFIMKNLNSIYEEGKRVKTSLKLKDVQETDLWFTKYHDQPRGVVLENDNEIRVNVNGEKADEIKEIFSKQQKVFVTIRHLGPQLKSGKFRQPTFMKTVLEGGL